MRAFSREDAKHAKENQDNHPSPTPITHSAPPRLRVNFGFSFVYRRHSSTIRNF